MKIIKQTGIIFLICWLSAGLEKLLLLPIPASVIGLALLLACLLTGLLKVSHVREESDFLLSNMAFFFVPAGVGLINYLDILKKNWFPILVICTVSTVITFAATAYGVRLTLYLMKRREK